MMGWVQRIVRVSQLRWVVVVTGMLGAGLAMADAPAPARALAGARPFVGPLLDMEASLYGVEAGVRQLPFNAEVSAATGWSPVSEALHWRVGASVPLGLEATAGVTVGDGPDAYLGRERGVAATLTWEPSWHDQVRARLFHGYVTGRGGSGVPAEHPATYGRLQHDLQLVYFWPLDVRLRTTAMYGHAGAAATGAGGGDFYALVTALPVRWDALHTTMRLGYSGGTPALPGWQLWLGGYDHGWLRGYRTEQFGGPMLANVTVEYRRPWLAGLGIPLLAQVEAGPFVDAGAVADYGRRWDTLEWHTGYGITAALPLFGMLLGVDAAWNDQGQMRWGLRASGEF